MNDGATFGACEFCYFVDNTGNPLAYSASLLRDALSRVVKYRSAYINGVAAEKIVHSGHSTQGRPETIQELGKESRLGLVRIARANTGCVQ